MFWNSFWPLSRHFQHMFLGTFRHFMDMFWDTLSALSRHFLDMFWDTFGHFLDASWTRSGHVLGHFLDTFWASAGTRSENNSLLDARVQSDEFLPLTITRDNS